ncbi:hemin ABC transporter substrate-binding protein [Phaeobacter gallaeciensis]|uniref:Hemin ABC transporter substrate-binding protein n=2 Tax=Roseobacteraceae TaxID=2854170 RepID=A0A366X8R0_9RHOB|nr:MULTISPECIES: ABC transporter substrate-binding protein [Roseobacteraceae]MBT3142405.1 ABC transporter substrate-binding protein [Falsiruegeria litorea]MBT8169367.1 ABC transporter substrate-binding protein [Falsiruegeria litorea]RBW60596.1 hemin ABC transporter substrate-binding protein [Phaeobacter gallaeciensis]
MRLSGLSVFQRGLSTFLALIWVTQIALADERPSRIISIGNSVTEIVYALGQEHRIAGRDRTSTYPAEVNELPDIGYMRALSPEGVLSVNPDLILSLEGAGPPESIAVLEKANVPYVSIPEEFTADGIVTRIQIVGSALGEETAAAALAEKVKAEITAAETAAKSATMGHPKRVLFVLSIQGGRILASGVDTAADGIIKMAGGVNAVSEFDGYKPMTPEAVALSKPDVILMMDRGGDHSAATAELFAMPALILTPAARNRHVVRMDGAHLLGFGPRTASAISQLSQALVSGNES